MLAIALALGASLGWGAADFLGGTKSRTAPLLSVLLVSQTAALVLLAVVAAGHGATPPDAATLAQASAAGLGELVGIAALYRGLAVGSMSVVAPVAATAPAVPLLVGLTTGEVPNTVQFAGLALAVAGLVVTSWRAKGADRPTGRTGAGVVYGLLAAAGFGTFFLTMGHAGGGNPTWALLTARATAVAVLVVVALVVRHRVAVTRSDLPAIASIGVLVVAADSLYAGAAGLGMVGVAAVLGSTHTLVTIALARFVHHEPLAKPQQAGIAISLLGILALGAA